MYLVFLIVGTPEWFVHASVPVVGAAMHIVALAHLAEAAAHRPTACWSFEMCPVE